MSVSKLVVMIETLHGVSTSECELETLQDLDYRVTEIERAESVPAALNKA